MLIKSARAAPLRGVAVRFWTWANGVASNGASQ